MFFGILEVLVAGQKTDELSEGPSRRRDVYYTKLYTEFNRQVNVDTTNYEKV